MQVEALQENLAKAINQASRVISPLPQLPILANLYLKAQKTGLTITGTSLETTISVHLPAKVAQAGEITVPAKNFTEMVSTMRAEKVKLELKKDRLLVSFSEGLAKFPTMPAQDFPMKEVMIGEKKLKKRLRFKARDLLEGLKRTAFAAAADETRPALSGVLFEAGQGKLGLVATDGYRLSQARVEAGQKGLAKPIIVPAKALREIEKSLDSEEEVEMIFEEGKGQVFFVQGSFILGTRLIEEEFPNFEKIIPEKGATRITIDREEAIDKLRTAAIFARESANIVHLEVGKEGVELGAKAAQAGEGSFKLAPIEQKGEEVRIAFNFRFLLEMFSVFKEKEVVAEFSGALAPAKFYAPKEPGFLHIIMPVRLQA